jgi:hypothetical protein
MNDNPYRAPQSTLVEASPEQTGDALFYVVSSTKFWLLMVATFGLYSVFWFYKHWSLLNRQHGGYWPVPRAIFSIFFTHSLFGEIDHLLKRKQLPFHWSPGGMATLYVVSSIAMNVSSILADKGIISGTVDLLSSLLIFPIFGSLYVAQRAANVAEGDPRGTSNSRFSGANIVWLLLGGCLWLLILMGTALIMLEGTDM